MKVFAISDLHLSTGCDKPMDVFGGNWLNYWQEICEDWSQKVENDDIVLICGDISWAMNLQCAMLDFEQIDKLNGTKIILKGNHDYWWQSYSKIKQNLPTNIIPIQNNAIKIGNFIFCGSRLWTMGANASKDDQKIIQREYLRLQMSLKQAKELQTNKEKIIVMTHFPPFDVSFASNQFTSLFEEYGVDSVVYGHLHGSVCRTELKYCLNGINYYLTSCDKLKNKLELIY